MAKTKREIKKELQKITDTIDIDELNKTIEIDGNFHDLIITKKTLKNIAEWALDGKSQFEIAQNLELTSLEWEYLLKVCPSIMIVMQHSTAYADLVVAGTLYQTAIGGQKIKKKVPLKIREYDNGRVIGEHYEMVEIEEITQPNPNLLKYLAEHKLSEQFGDKKVDSSEEHRKIIDAMTEDELAEINNRM